MVGNEDCETCWICLEGVEGPDAQPGPLHANRLIKPCRCPRLVHSVCLAKWQLSQSGRSEEKFCRFCKERLPEWQANLALPGMGAVEPVMSVHFNGQTHMVKVKPGEEGRVAFIQDVRRLLRLRDNQEFSITFECKVPGHGMFLDLKGLSSYDAAVFCAAMTAVERQRIAAHKAQKSGAAPGPLLGGGTPLCSSAPAALNLAATAASGTASPTSISLSANSASSDSGGATSSSTPSSSSASYTLPPVATTSSTSRTRTETRSSSAGASETECDATASSPARPRTASFSSALPAAGRAGGLRGASAGPVHPGAGESASSPAGEAALRPSSSSSTHARSARPGWPLPLHGGLALAGTDRSSQGRGAAAAVADSTTHPDGAALSGPRAHRAGAAARGARGTAAGAGWGSSTYDSACEVEPQGAAAGEGAAGGARTAGAGAGASAGGTGGVDVRHKSVRQLRAGGVPGGRLPALAQAPAGRQQCGSSATWLSRLLLCASFGGGQEAAT